MPVTAQPTLTIEEAQAIAEAIVAAAPAELEIERVVVEEMVDHRDQDAIEVTAILPDETGERVIEEHWDRLSETFREIRDAIRARDNSRFVYTGVYSHTGFERRYDGSDDEDEA